MDRIAQGKTHMVRSLNKDGTVTRAAITYTDYQVLAFTNEADATKHARFLETLNPGRKFAVIALPVCS
jgi:hypothetical protein